VITLKCDNCDKAFQVEDDAAGEKASCPYCGDVNKVPAASGAAAAVTAVPVVAHVPTGKPASEEPERVIAVVRQGMFRAHPFWYLLMVLVGVGGIALAVMAKTSSVRVMADNRWLMWVGVAGVATAVLWWLGWWAAPHRWVKLIITNKRTIRQEGIVVRKTSEVMHKHVTNVMIRQGFMDRILNVGYIGIDSAGQGGEPTVGSAAGRSNIEIEVEHIPKPYAVKKTIDQYRLGPGG
jgi:membrane protein YdbS with pleckstrin-like domain